MPDRAVSGLVNIGEGEFLLRGLQFLNAYDVGLRLLEPARPDRGTAAYLSSTVAVAALAFDHRHDGGADGNHREREVDDRGCMFRKLRHQQREQRGESGRRAQLAQPLEQAPAAADQLISTHERILAT